MFKHWSRFLQMNSSSMTILNFRTYFTQNRKTALLIQLCRKHFNANFTSITFYSTFPRRNIWNFIGPQCPLKWGPLKALLFELQKRPCLYISWLMFLEFQDASKSLGPIISPRRRPFTLTSHTHRRGIIIHKWDSESTEYGGEC